ncbi:MAG TPA: hypothetical protein VGT03_06200 [Candidatus Acidoferrales bacterium]|nr:hypothetical protein [Candidatus Acidoferrales bacterium]
MLTIFAIPKPFSGHIGTIQWNAIRSWTLLRPRPQIILFGNEEGTGEIARELSLHHIPIIACNEFGTPLLNDVLEQAYVHAQHRVLCYVNADILLLEEFARAVEVVSSKLSDFLIVSKRIDLKVTERIEFHGDWDLPLKRKLGTEGVPGPHTAIDIFVFAGGMYRHAPPFAIGRMWFDHWFIKTARQAGVPVVDVSVTAPVVHQNHDYTHVQGGRQGIFASEEGQRNLKYYDAGPESFTLLSATHDLTAGGRLQRVRFRQSEFRLKHFVWKKALHDTAKIRRRIGLSGLAWVKPGRGEKAGEDAGLNLTTPARRRVPEPEEPA